MHWDLVGSHEGVEGAEARILDLLGVLAALGRQLKVLLAELREKLDEDLVHNIFVCLENAQSFDLSTAITLQKVGKHADHLIREGTDSLRF